MKTVSALKKAIAGYKKFIEPVDERGEYKKGSRLKAFNYLGFTNYCCQISDDTPNGGEGGGYLLRDLVMESKDPKFDSAKPYKFLGMDTID